MYIGHARLCVSVSICLSVAAFPHYCTDPDVTWGMVGVSPSCVLLGEFAIGARVSLPWQHSAEREMSASASTWSMPGWFKVVEKWSCANNRRVYSTQKCRFAITSTWPRFLTTRLICTMSVGLSSQPPYTSILYRNGWAVSGSYTGFPQFSVGYILHCFTREFGYLQKWGYFLLEPCPKFRT